MVAAIDEGVHAFLWAWGGEYPDAGRGFLDPIFSEYPFLYRDQHLEELLVRAVPLPDQSERLRRGPRRVAVWAGPR
jgi:hypothetical protein